MTGTVRRTQHGEVAALLVDHPPVNVLSEGVRQGLHDALEALARDTGTRAVVLAGAGRTFIAGADITSFGKPPSGPSLHGILARIEASTIPFVAALHGTALGGGLETALCCDYRVAAPGTKLGLPEIELGLMPGAGGTQRLTRLVGAEEALAMMISGEPIDADRAKALGLVDAIVEGDLVEGAIAFARSVIAKGPRKIRDLDAHLAHDRAHPEIFDRALARVAKERRGETAPARIVEAVRAAVSPEGFDAGLAEERALFETCLDDPQSRAKIHVFFAERAASKVRGVGKDVRPVDVRRAVVVGAGTMGTGIATCLLRAGIAVKIVEADSGALAKGVDRIRGYLERDAEKGRIDAAMLSSALGALAPAGDLDAAKDADLVIEAVFEEMTLKREIFGKLDRLAPARAVLATNTSSLDVDAIAATTSRPGQVVGMHFFSPAHIMKLLEIVRGAATGPATLQTALAVGKRIGKTTVVAGNCDGFIGNRMLAPYRREGELLVEEGALPQQVDGALERFGLAMGPFRMIDLAGLDISWRVRKAEGRLGLPGSRVSDALCERGRYGQKTGSGWYRYEPGSRTALPDPAVEALVAEIAGGRRRAISDDEILERCLYALVNEATKILDEGIAERASDIDVVYVRGYGFPSWRGGPMYYADEIGLASVVAAIEAHRKAGRIDWDAAPGLVARANAGKRFRDG